MAAGSLSNAQALKNARALALFSFGQGETTVSPLNLAAAVTAIAAAMDSAITLADIFFLLCECLFIVLLLLLFPG